MVAYFAAQKRIHVLPTFMSRRFEVCTRTAEVCTGGGSSRWMQNSREGLTQQHVLACRSLLPLPPNNIGATWLARQDAKLAVAFLEHAPAAQAAAYKPRAGGRAGGRVDCDTRSCPSPQRLCNDDGRRGRMSAGRGLAHHAALLMLWDPTTHQSTHALLPTPSLPAVSPS